MMDTEKQPALFHCSLDENLEKVKKELGNSTDLVTRQVRLEAVDQLLVGILYTEGLVDKNMISSFLESLMIHARKTVIPTEAEREVEPLMLMKDFLLTMGGVEEVYDFDHLYDAILTGDTVMLVEGYTYGFIINTKQWEDRGVQEPSVQTVVRGSREAFSENLRTNTALVRRRINNRNLWLETVQVGEMTQTKVAMMYIKGVVQDSVVTEVRERLGQIKIDGILESGNIEELIQDHTFTPFPTVYNTERPDSVAAGLLEGRVAILVDGTPIVLLVPAVFVQFFQSPEDYYMRADFGILRILRLISFFVALLGPSIYVAITTFHQEMLQTNLIMSIAAQREGVPFPAAVEAMLMEFTFEMLREAGVRMPRAVGSAISIVGALVLGEAAVQAGLVSPATVIVVSITAITSFVFPSFSMSIPIRLLRFGLIALAASFGFIGIFVGMIALCIHLCTLRSFGVPYMAPLAPMNLADQKDTLLRIPIWMMHTRPHFLRQKNSVRERKSKI
ncbi:spore germination protein [Brevibacillus formosus]|uniref:Spore germination protein KA n=1 Tax=Brevibacillus formosus TaxID=54913 RepID=A0A837KK00_9BACL|nr:spore germination protein [Brevibacillus formosus]KLH97455.1 spore gernimation protein KA [Brevibacillus formosus]MED1955588.1 spore germination protein [Brevibacillus formosus]PSJ95196.1 spore germination protein [Brevibacillus formosus]GED60295.1 spore germination protein KA [Brevibacillus formosus]